MYCLLYIVVYTFNNTNNATLYCAVTSVHGGAHTQHHTTHYCLVTGLHTQQHTQHYTVLCSGQCTYWCPLNTTVLCVLTLNTTLYSVVYCLVYIVVYTLNRTPPCITLKYFVMWNSTTKVFIKLKTESPKKLKKNLIPEIFYFWQKVFCLDQFDTLTTD